MRKVNWPVVAPLLLVGVLLWGLAFWRTAKSGGIPSWAYPFGLAILLLTAGSVTAVLALRRRKSGRTWELMVREDPHAAYFIAFVYPPVTTQLLKLGWSLHGTAFASVPAIGVSVSPGSVKFWEAGVAKPTLTLKGSDFESAVVGTVSDGYRGHPAIELELKTANRSNRLQLNLRNDRHQNLSPADTYDALELFRALKAFTGTKPFDG